MREVECRRRILRLAEALGAYANAHNGYLPKSWGALSASFGNPNVHWELACPYERNERAVSYEFACGKRVTDYDLERLKNGEDLLLWHKKGVHSFDHARGFLARVSVAIYHDARTGAWTSPAPGD